MAPEEADLKKASNILESADIIFVSGGDVEAGMDVLQEKNMMSFFNELYRQGKPFFGISAGAIMLADRWIRWPDPDDDDSAELFPCLGAIHGFFVSLIDLRNVVTLYKHLRWGVDDAAAFIPGGTIEPIRLQQASANKDAAYLDALVRRIAGRAAPPLAASESALETVLLTSLTHQLRKTGGDSEGVGLILEYIWRVYVHARNGALLLHAGSLGANALERELIA